MPINIANGLAVSMGQLAFEIAERARTTAVQFLKDKLIGIKSRVINNEIIKSIGFVQKILLKIGIDNLYSLYLKKYRSDP